jgi:hypothetical protein
MTGCHTGFTSTAARPTVPGMALFLVLINGNVVESVELLDVPDEESGA